MFDFLSIAASVVFEIWSDIKMVIFIILSALVLSITASSYHQQSTVSSFELDTFNFKKSCLTNLSLLLNVFSSRCFYYSFSFPNVSISFLIKIVLLPKFRKSTTKISKITSKINYHWNSLVSGNIFRKLGGETRANFTRR